MSLVWRDLHGFSGHAAVAEMVARDVGKVPAPPRPLPRTRVGVNNSITQLVLK